MIFLLGLGTTILLSYLVRAFLLIAAGFPVLVIFLVCGIIGAIGGIITRRLAGSL
jgi:hypothetical protein